MDREEMKAYVKAHLEDYVSSVTEPDARAGRGMYVCPLCGSGSGKDGAFSVKGSLWKCFSCGAGGDAFTLYGRLNGVSEFNRQLEGLCAFFGIGSGSEAVSREKFGVVAGRFGGERVVSPSAGKRRRPDGFSVAEYVEACSQEAGRTDYFRSRGLDEGIVRLFRLGYDEKRRRIVIPYDPEGTYCIARSVDGKRFYKPPADIAGEEPIFNASALAGSGPVFVCESPIDALSLIMCGASAIALGGVGTSKLMRHLDRSSIGCVLIVCFDNDDAGREAGGRLLESLLRRGLKAMPARFSLGLYGRSKDANDLLVSNEAQLRRDVGDMISEAFRIKRC